MIKYGILHIPSGTILLNAYNKPPEPLWFKSKIIATCWIDCWLKSASNFGESCINKPNNLPACNKLSIDEFFVVELEDTREDITEDKKEVVDK